MDGKLKIGTGLEIAECLDRLSIARDAAANCITYDGSPDAYQQASMSADEEATTLAKLLTQFQS